MVLGVDNSSILNTLETNSTSLVYSWLTGMNIERIGDYLKGVNKTLSKNKLKKEEIEYLKGVFNKEGKPWQQGTNLCISLE